MGNLQVPAAYKISNLYPWNIRVKQIRINHGY